VLGARCWLPGLKPGEVDVDPGPGTQNLAP